MTHECMNCKHCRIVETEPFTYNYYCQRSSRNESIKDMEQVADNGTCNYGNWEENKKQ